MIEGQVLVESQTLANKRMLFAHNAHKPVRKELTGAELGRKVPEDADRKVRSPISQRNPIVHDARKEPQRYVRGFLVQDAVHCRSQDEQYVVRGEDSEGAIQVARRERHCGAQHARGFLHKAAHLRPELFGAGVRTILRPARTRSGSSSRLRIRASAWLVAGVESPRRFAARVTFPS